MPMHMSMYLSMHMSTHRYAPLRDEVIVRTVVQSWLVRALVATMSVLRVMNRYLFITIQT